MSAISCTCDTGVNGFGFIDCFGKPSRVVGVAFQQLKSGGAENYLNAPISQANWEGSLWNKTASLRISVLNDVKEYSSDRDDAITETIDDIDYYLKDGKKMISFTVIGAPYKLKAYVDGLRCGRNGVYFISESNQLLGRRIDNDTAAIGLIPIQKGTITSKMIDATVATFSKMMVTFQLDERYDDSEFVYVPSDKITADLQDTEPMIQAIATASVTASVTIEVTLLWAASGRVSDVDLEPLENFDVSSYFSLYNNDTSSTVAISAVSEGSAGVYTLTITAQTTGDSLTLSAGALAPFDFADVTGLVAL